MADPVENPKKKLSDLTAEEIANMPQEELDRRVRAEKDLSSAKEIMDEIMGPPPPWWARVLQPLAQPLPLAENVSALDVLQVYGYGMDGSDVGKLAAKKLLIATANADPAFKAKLAEAAFEYSDDAARAAKLPLLSRMKEGIVSFFNPRTTGRTAEAVLEAAEATGAVTAATKATPGIIGKTLSFLKLAGTRGNIVLAGAATVAEAGLAYHNNDNEGIIKAVGGGGGSLVGAWGGAKVGMLIGAWGGPVGIAIGGVVGGVAGGIGGYFAGRKAAETGIDIIKEDGDETKIKTSAQYKDIFRKATMLASPTMAGAAVAEIAAENVVDDPYQKGRNTALFNDKTKTGFAPVAAAEITSDSELRPTDRFAVNLTNSAIS